MVHRRLSTFRASAIGTLVLLASAGACAQSALLNYSYAGEAWSLGNDSQWVVNQVANGQSFTKVEGSATAASDFAGDIQTAAGHSSGTAGIYVDYGHLGASANAFAQVGDIPTPPPNYGAIQSSTEGIATANVGYLDTLTVHSSSLAAGTPVTVNFLITLDGSIRTDGSATAYAFTSVYSDYSFNGVYGTLRPIDTGSGFTGEYSGTFDSFVGSSFVVAADLFVAAQADAGNYYTSGTYSAIDIAFLHTEMNYFSVAGDADAQLISASGHDYAMPSAVPEPSAMLMCALGLLGCAARIPRRSKTSA